MAKNISLLGADYPDVPAVVLPQTGGGTAEFMDTTDANATAGDILQGKTAYVNNVKVTGTMPSGGGGSSDVNVIFIDYDGTVVDTKTKAEINAMTSDSELPSNPSHTGLVAQGWNWTVEQMKAQFTSDPNQDICVGQLYVTSSGASEIDVKLKDECLSPILTIAVKGTVTIDWGDNTTPDTVAGSSLWTKLGPTHTYSSAGNYTISVLETENSEYTFFCDSYSLLLRKNDANTPIPQRSYANCVLRVRLGSGTKSIGQYTFYLCNHLEYVTIPNNITGSFSNYIFNNCYNIKSITIPNGVTAIESTTFGNCNLLKYASIPSTVTGIGQNAFQYCTSLIHATIPIGVTAIGVNAFQYCYLKKSISVRNVAGPITASSFAQDESIETVYIPNTVTKVNASAFQSCVKLKTVELASGLKSLEDSAFNGCRSLESIAIPNTVTRIGTNVFSGCLKLRTATISNSLATLSNNTFSSCVSLESITIPDSVTSIGESVFSGCYHLETVAMTNSVTSIGRSAFNNCRTLKTITLSSQITEITYSMLASCYSLESVTIPNGVTAIGENAFVYCYSLSSIVIPSAVTSIGKNAFSYCYSLRTITIPSNVTSIEATAFGDCSGIDEYHIQPTQVPTGGANMFRNLQSGCVIYVPYSADHSILNAYQTATNWSTYASYMQEEPT